MLSQFELVQQSSIWVLICSNDSENHLFFSYIQYIYEHFTKSLILVGDYSCCFCLAFPYNIFYIPVLFLKGKLILWLYRNRRIASSWSWRSYYRPKEHFSGTCGPRSLSWAGAWLSYPPRPSSTSVVLWWFCIDTFLLPLTTSHEKSIIYLFSHSQISVTMRDLLVFAFKIVFKFWFFAED